jgi:hypothetical protein
MVMNERAHGADRRMAGLAWRCLPLVIGALFVAVAGNTHAALYKWTDDHGIVHYSDQLPVDAVNRASSQLNRQGMTVHKTEQARPLVQHIAKTESEEQKLREAERERVIAARRDRALVESYANEAEIDLAKSRALATIEGQMQSARAFIEQMAKRRQELEDKKPTYAPRPVPGSLLREIETVDAEVERQNELIEAKQKEAASVAARYDADKARFRELHAAASGQIVTNDGGRSAVSQPIGIEFTSAR